MSCNYYFGKWNKTLKDLNELVKLDLEYQNTKAHDKNWCDAVLRLTGVLGKYLAIYNDTADCCRHNLQVQKAECQTEIIKAIGSRILEIKDQLRKLTGSEYQFLGHGLIDQKLTTYDIEVEEVYPKDKRDDSISLLVLESIQKAEERKRKSISMIAIPDLKDTEEKLSRKLNWWESDNESENANNRQRESKKGINVTAVYELEKVEEVTPEQLEIRKMVTLIQAHERLRKLTLLQINQKQKREKWEKELKGALRFPATLDLRERSAKMIQKIFRAYFEIKRERFRESKRDEILALKVIEKRNLIHKNTQMISDSERYIEKYKQYESQWKNHYDKIKQKYIDKKYGIIEDDIHEEIINWFRQWFDETSFFINIPKDDKGGSMLIVKEEIPSPKEWLEKYEAFLEKKRRNKNKTAYELKTEKLEAKKEKLLQKRAKHIQKKMEEKILKKMMSNPKFHPGYCYPLSKRISQIIQAMEDYRARWSTLDFWEESGVKEKFVYDVDISNAYMDAKLQIRTSVDVAMRETFKVLKKALIADYNRNGEQMPQQIKERFRRKKKQRKLKEENYEDIAEKLENLAYRGFLKQYSRVSLADFIGDPNFAADDLRCNLQTPEAFSGDTRALWWEKCRDLANGSHRILLVGAKGSGKTTLVRVLASINDAVLYEVDPAWVPDELLSAVYLRDLARSLAACARATRPSVIYVRHVHRLYYRKAPPEEDVENLNLIRRYLLRKLVKSLRKIEKITIVASCIDPWLSNSKKMLKLFPSVVLLPNTSYSTVNIILSNWILKLDKLKIDFNNNCVEYLFHETLSNHTIPRNLDVQTLARALQGYSFGHIKDTLNKFLTADRVIKIAAYGLRAGDLYECFLDSEDVKVDYDRYLKWYTEKSHWGRKGKKLLEDQREFQVLSDKWEQKMKKKKLDGKSSGVSADIDN